MIILIGLLLLLSKNKKTRETGKVAILIGLIWILISYWYKVATL